MMLLNRAHTAAAVCCVLVLAICADVRAEDWMQKNLTVAGGGTFEFEFPKSWGKKPAVDAVEGITTVRFGPYGPRKKPFFLVHIESVTALEPITSEDIKKMTELEVSNHKKIAVETDIPINDFDGPKVSGHYFSITDRSSKIGEFDYLTLAILGSDHLLIKCYFFSSDGAPDFGADAMQMMGSIKYTAPPPEPEAEEK
jgi:hypothetical protein